MIFIAGVSPGQKKLEYSNSMNICPRCGRYGRYEVVMEYNSFTLFFIPLIKWDKKYYAKSSCCGYKFRIKQGVGERIEDGENITIKPEDLKYKKKSQDNRRFCDSCGHVVEKDFSYCPGCGVNIK